MYDSQLNQSMVSQNPSFMPPKAGAQLGPHGVEMVNGTSDSATLGGALPAAHVHARW
jgi:hypothetical protein